MQFKTALYSLVVGTFVLPTKQLFNNYLLQTCDASKLRNLLRNELQRDYKYVPYSKAKQIIHTKINNIDLYGDNEEPQNIEHVFPQFLFKDDSRKKEMKADLHNLYLCNTKLNTCRQNFKYVNHHHAIEQSNSDKNTYILDQKGAKITNYQEVFKKQGYIMSVNRKQKTFIPSTFTRGKIARTLTYFAVKYDYLNKLHDVININDLVLWNFIDPVDTEEYLKNMLTMKYQNNINPFIIYPELVPFTFADILDHSKYNNDLKRTKPMHHTIDHVDTLNYLLNANTKPELDNQEIMREFSKLEKRILRLNSKLQEK